MTTTPIPTPTRPGPPPIDLDKWLTRIGSIAGIVALLIAVWPSAPDWATPAAIGSAVTALAIAARRWWYSRR